MEWGWQTSGHDTVCDGRVLYRTAATLLPSSNLHPTCMSLILRRHREPHSLQIRHTVDQLENNINHPSWLEHGIAAMVVIRLVGTNVANGAPGVRSLRENMAGTWWLAGTTGDPTAPALDPNLNGGSKKAGLASDRPHTSPNCLD
jgi:hypothetical protein